MHVLIIPSWYKTKASPLNGSFFCEQAQALNRNGIQVTVACVEFWGRKAIKLKKKEKYGFSYENDNGIPTYRYMTYRFPNKFRMPFSKKTIVIPYLIEIFIYLKLKKMIERVIKERGMPDIIHLHSNVIAGEAARRLSEKYKIRLVITEHSTGYAMNNLPKYITDITNRNIKVCDKLIVVGKDLYSYFSNKCDSSKLILIPNLINTDNFKIVKGKESNEKFIFYSLAFLDSKQQIYKKGFDLLIEAFSKEFGNNPNVELIIGGDGKAKYILEEMVAKLQCNNIRFLGEVSRMNAPIYMNNCNAFVLPSRYETFGVVFIEALAIGKPVIGTKGTGPELFVDSSNGILVEKDDIEELRNALRFILNNYHNYNSQKIREYCIDKFSEKTVCKQIKDVYIQCLQPFNK